MTFQRHVPEKIEDPILPVLAEEEQISPQAEEDEKARLILELQPLPLKEGASEADQVENLLVPPLESDTDTDPS